MTVYLDNNATTPLDEDVREAMLPFLLDQFGNPSSIHQKGRIARAAIDTARGQVASLVNAHPSQVIFTSGGTEANNLALKGATARRPPGRMAVSAIEHSSVLKTAQSMARYGWAVELIDVDRNGTVTAGALEQALSGNPDLVSVMWANNETGVMQDIASLAARVRQRGAIMHTDAVQAAGKTEIDFASAGVHMLSLSAHKIYGPKGVGALVVDKALEIEPLLHGGGHEMGYRSGTENVAGIVGFGKAAELASQELDQRRHYLQRLRDYLEQQLGRLPEVVILGGTAQRLSNTVPVAAPGIAGETMLMYLDEHGIAVSSGSACSSARTDTSHVLLAMKIDAALAGSSLRISLGKYTTIADIDRLIAALQALTEQRRVFGASVMR